MGYNNNKTTYRNNNNDQTSAGPAELDFSKLRPLEVVVDGTSRDDFEYAMKKFKVAFQKEGVLGFLKDRAGYEKPSDKKRRKIREAENRKRIEESRQKLILSGEWDKIQQDKINRKMQKEERRAKQRIEESQ